MAAATIGGLLVVDLAVALALGGYALVRVNAEGSLAAAFGVLAMTVPVAWCRRSPITAAGVLAAGGVLNGLFFGSLVRCGTALPAVFIAAFAVGVRCDRRRAAAGFALCAVNVASQAIYDPQLGRPALLLLLPLLGGFFALGRIVRTRTAALETLWLRTEELRRQRDETARLTVLAHRARVSDELDAELGDRIARIGATAAGRPAAPAAALASIEHQARDVLNRMREIVGRPTDDLASATMDPPPSAAAERRRWPLAASVSLSAALLVLWAFAQSVSPGGPATLLLAVPTLSAYLLGADAGLAVGLAGVALLSLGLQAAGGAFNPLFEMITVGPWLAGRVVRSHKELATQVETRNRELEEARALYALEEVRYDHLRIERELHDVVAHCMTVIVVQASAGQRVPARAAGALDAVAELALEARKELGLVAKQLDEVDTDGAQMIEELVQRTAATGLHVRYRPGGDLRNLRPPASDAAYRVVRESLTNAMKHAPGAPVEINVREARDASFDVEVTTAPHRGSSGLMRTGDGRGLAGMHERVAACGGTLIVGPTPTGGWQVKARLPGQSSS